MAVDVVHADTVFLNRLYALIMVDHGSRWADLLGVTAHPQRRLDHPGRTQPPDEPRRTPDRIALRYFTLDGGSTCQGRAC